MELFPSGIKPWALSRARLTTWAGLSFGIGVALLIVGPTLTLEWVRNFLTAIGSSFVSIAGALLITEYWLKPAYTQDVLAVVGVRDEVFNTGLRQLGPESQVDWSAVYREATEVTVVLNDLRSFQARHWPEICERARLTGMRVRLLAAPSGYGEAPTKISDLTSPTGPLKEFETEWRRLDNGKQLNKNSMLSLEAVNVSMPYTLFLTERTGVLVFKALASDASSRGFALVVEGAGRSTVIRWVHERLPMLEGSVEIPPVWYSPNWKPRKDR